MASTIDFSTLDDQDLLYSYQRVNRSRFPENFTACTLECHRRGLNLPERFEIDPLISESAFTAFQNPVSLITTFLGRRSQGLDL